MTRAIKHTLRCGLIASALAGLASSVFAQADLSPEQRSESYKATVGKPTTSPHRPPGFNLQVGDTVPGSAPTYKMPDSVEDKAIHRYESATSTWSSTTGWCWSIHPRAGSWRSCADQSRLVMAVLVMAIHVS